MNVVYVMLVGNTLVVWTKINLDQAIGTVQRKIYSVHGERPFASLRVPKRKP